MQASFPSVGAAISRRQTTHPRPVTAQPRPVLRGACSRGGNRSSGPVWERLGATAEHAPNRPSSAFARPATGFAQPLASGQSLKRLTDELSTKLVRLLPLLSRLLPLLSRAFYCALPRALLRMIPFSPSHDSSHDSSRTTSVAREVVVDFRSKFSFAPPQSSMFHERAGSEINPRMRCHAGELSLSWSRNLTPAGCSSTAGHCPITAAAAWCVQSSNGGLPGRGQV